MGMKYKRHGQHIYRDKRWPALRLMARRRDGWACVKCGARGRIEVDHIQPVRTHPERAFDLQNLQCLCAVCHAKKTRVEVGLPELSPERQAWRRLVSQSVKTLSKQEESTCSTL